MGLASEYFIPIKVAWKKVMTVRKIKVSDITVIYC